jgi:4'-phosphopantetheinyl transferase
LTSAVSPAELAFSVLAADGVEVLGLALAELGPFTSDAGPLSPPERARAQRLERQSDRQGFLAAHLLLRDVLGARLGRPPESLALGRRACPLCGGDHGRPALIEPGASIEFSLARSDKLVLLALAAVPVGVDVEALPSPEEALEVSSMLQPAEQDEVRGAPPAQRPEVCARIWTRKEALLKGIGSGVADERLQTLYLGAGPAVTAPPGWTILDLPVPSGQAAAVAVARE